ncbi:MAG: HEAT repeat domain-containing protein [Anaerolineaceae bacterium]|nr:HEAT repeat domain-containing protein [Anaerolineaceae bacterium]
MLFEPSDVEKMIELKDVEGLIKALDHEEDTVVRRNAVIGLEQVGDQSAVTALIPLLQEMELGKLAADALDAVGWQPDSSEDGAWYWFTRQEWLKCLELGKAAVGPVSLTLVEPKNRASVIKNLVSIGSVAVETLLAIVKDRQSTVRSAAVEALGKIGDVSVVQTLVPLLKDEDENVRLEVQDALARLSADKRSDEPKESTLEYYTLMKTSLGNRMHLEVSTERWCVYCEELRDVDLLDPDYPLGVGECLYGVRSFDDTCKYWKHNTKVRFWLSKGYMQNNLDGWPRRPWYRLFDDGPDGEKGTH